MTDTTKKTPDEIQQVLQTLRNEAALLAEQNPQDWQTRAIHLHKLGQLLHLASDLRFQLAGSHRDSSWDTWQMIVDQWHDTYYGNFTQSLEVARGAVKTGDISGLETVLEFLEADPYFFRSGYLKAELIPCITRFAPFAEETAARLRQVVLNRVATRWGREFPYYKRLAKVVESISLRNALNDLAHDSNIIVQARALSVLRHLNGDPKLAYRNREFPRRRRKRVAHLRHNLS